ncbi:MAG: hypothetical protein ACOYPS_11505, partial [Phycisphaerales bacterium]
MRATALVRAMACGMIAAAAAGQPVVVDLGLLDGDAGLAPAAGSQTETAVAKGGVMHLVTWTDTR